MSDAALRPLLEEAIRNEPLLSAEALESVQMGSEDEILNFDGLKALGRFVGKPHERLIVDGLANRKLLRAFTLALSVRGAAIPEGWEMALEQVVEHREIKLDAEEAAPGGARAGEAEPAGEAPAAEEEEEQEEEEEEEGEEDDAGEEGDEDLLRATMSEEDWIRFVRLVRSTRCRIRLNGQVVGSGSLVGPSTVLTAWHVIRRADALQGVRIDVDFADGSRIPAVLPARFQSPCGDRELNDLFPQNDNEVVDAHDVALLQLRRPVGASLSRVAVADPDIKLSTNDPMTLVHYPKGEYRGLSSGIFYKLPRLRSRWGHSVRARGGSSGGGCFNNRMVLVGVHQGRAPPGRKTPGPRGRLVPASRFPAKLREMIAADEAPPQAWSLDGTAHGPLVLGRREFFTAFAAASRPAGRIRGIRVRRVDAEADTTGIPFTYLMLEYLVARGVDLRSLRIGFEADIRNFTDEVVRRAAVAGFDLGPIAAAQGVEADQTTLEAAASDRARRAAILLDAAAAKACVRLWVFLEHPSSVFGDSLRVGFEAFVAQALRLDNLRLVVAGYEALTVPGQEFQFADEADREGQPGLLTEFLDGFRRSDVEHLLMTAASNLGVEISDDLVRDLADRVLENRVAKAGVYEPEQAGAVVDALRPELVRLARRAPTAGAANGG